MDDLISRQQAINALSTITLYKGSIPFDTAVMRIEQLPPIQPEIVRCGECKYHHKRICPIERYFSLDGFCSRGERREVTT